jgi:hypothetical protein
VLRAREPPLRRRSPRDADRKLASPISVRVSSVPRSGSVYSSFILALLEQQLGNFSPNNLGMAAQVKKFMPSLQESGSGPHSQKPGPLPDQRALAKQNCEEDVAGRNDPLRWAEAGNARRTLLVFAF